MSIFFCFRLWYRAREAIADKKLGNTPNLAATPSGATQCAAAFAHGLGYQPHSERRHARFTLHNGPVPARYPMGFEAHHRSGSKSHPISTNRSLFDLEIAHSRASFSGWSGCLRPAHLVGGQPARRSLYQLCKLAPDAPRDVARPGFL